MKRLLVLGGAVALLASGNAALAQGDKKEAQPKNADVHARARIRAIRGNPGFHYGTGYNLYSMHVHAKKSADKK